MIEIPYLRNHKEDAINALEKRHIEVRALVEEILRTDEERRSCQTELDETLAESKRLSKSIGQLYKEGKQEEAEEAKSKTAELKEKSKNLQDRQEELKGTLSQLLTQLPNIPQPSVKAGKGEEDNELVKEVGDIKSLPESARPHWELAQDYDIIDFETGVKVTGAGFPVYKGQGARLQRALINFFLEENQLAGYTEYIPPFLVNADSGFGTGQLPDKEGQMYHITNDDLYAIPTAEVPLTNMFRDEILERNQLPLKCTAYTPCFRREAGSYGKDVRGLNRLHQFDKVEVVNVVEPEQSEKALQEMVDHVAYLLDKLKLPFRILRLCGGDLGFAAAITYDFEVWSAAQKRWLEVSSVSNFETYQSNRLKLRYRNEERKTALCHTLNGSALAVPRILAALLENNQSEEGIHLPEALFAFTGFKKITK